VVYHFGSRANGKSSGIGLLIAAALEHNSAEKVYIVGRRKEVLENAAKTNNVCPD